MHIVCHTHSCNNISRTLQSFTLGLSLISLCMTMYQTQPGRESDMIDNMQDQCEWESLPSDLDVAGTQCSIETEMNDAEIIDAEPFYLSSQNHDTPTGKLRCKFGMEFQDGKFVDTSGKRFVFDVNDGDHAQNQARYEEIGEMVSEVVYELLETDGKLMRLPMKPEIDPSDRLHLRAGSFIFTSPHLENYERVLVLIHGTGVVRAGQWARRLILNDNLDSGTQLPYIKEAHARGYGVVVLNTNYNTDDFGRIPGHHSPEAHAETVWSKVVSRTAATEIAIVAHSYGGAVVSSLLQHHLPEFEKKVKAIALTDAMLFAENRRARKYTSKVACNWVTNHKPVGTYLHDDGTATKVSAGTLIHEETSWMAFREVFKFIQSKFSEKQK